jgi:pantoate--beta-alanine ligase
MIKFEKIADLNTHLEKLKQDGFKIGFIPTMGALHKGHLSLIERAKQDNAKTVCSIFVNPTQFTNQNDLLNYPRTIDADIKLLESANCDILFNPDVKEIYPKPVNTFFNFGFLEDVMEGRYRKGHFNGMAIVVNRLFEIVKPHFAYFGEKDYQQLVFVKMLVRMMELPIQIIGCPIIRENDGLAMSSRNIHLSPQEKKDALIISQTLFKAKELVNKMTVEELKSYSINNLKIHPAIDLEYFEIAECGYLKPIKTWQDYPSIRAFIALKIGTTRLIDNIELVP